MSRQPKRSSVDARQLSFGVDIVAKPVSTEAKPEGRPKRGAKYVCEVLVVMGDGIKRWQQSTPLDLHDALAEAQRYRVRGFETRVDEVPAPRGRR